MQSKQPSNEPVPISTYGYGYLFRYRERVFLKYTQGLVNTENEILSSFNQTKAGKQVSSMKSATRTDYDSTFWRHERYVPLLLGSLPLVLKFLPCLGFGREAFLCSFKLNIDSDAYLEQNMQSEAFREACREALVGGAGIDVWCQETEALIVMREKYPKVQGLYTEYTALLNPAGSPQPPVVSSERLIFDHGAELKGKILSRNGPRETKHVARDLHNYVLEIIRRYKNSVKKKLMEWDDDDGQQEPPTKKRTLSGTTAKQLKEQASKIDEMKTTIDDLTARVLSQQMYIHMKANQLVLFQNHLRTTVADPNDTEFQTKVNDLEASFVQYCPNQPPPGP